MTADHSNQYWLLAGDVPTGPFSMEQIHIELAEGRVNLQTPICLVGDNSWQPIIHIQGFGTDNTETSAGELVPSASSNLEGACVMDVRQVVDQGETRSSSSSTPEEPVIVLNSATPHNTSSPPDSTETGILIKVIGLGVFAVVGLAIIGSLYGLYEWVRPLTAMEVSERFDSARTTTEAKLYATPRVYPYIDDIISDTIRDPNRTIEFTSEIEGRNEKTKYLGFRGSWFVQEEGRRLNIEGYYILVQQDGWKVDDMVIMGIEGYTLPNSISVFDESLIEDTEQNEPPTENTEIDPAQEPEPAEINNDTLQPGSVVKDGVVNLNKLNAENEWDTISDAILREARTNGESDKKPFIFRASFWTWFAPFGIPGTIIGILCSWGRKDN